MSSAAGSPASPPRWSWRAAGAKSAFWRPSVSPGARRGGMAASSAPAIRRATRPSSAGSGGTRLRACTGCRSRAPRRSRPISMAWASPTRTGSTAFSRPRATRPQPSSRRAATGWSASSTIAWSSACGPRCRRRWRPRATSRRSTTRTGFISTRSTTPAPWPAKSSGWAASCSRPRRPAPWRKMARSALFPRPVARCGPRTW